LSASAPKAMAMGLALHLIDRLTVRAEDLVSAGAPKYAAGELVIFLSKGLVEHFFAPQIRAADVKLRGGIGIAHGLVLQNLAAASTARLTAALTNCTL
jgi:hypothetical protein